MTSEVETPSDPANDGPRPLPEIETIFGALVTAASTAGLTDLQALVAAALCEAMTGVVLDPHACLYVTPPQLAEAIGHEDEFFRNRIVQSMMLLGLLVKPFPIEVGRRIGDYAEALKLDERMHQDLHNFSPAAFDAAIVDFARNGYVGEFLEHARPVLHTDHDIGDGWGAVEDDPELAQRWDDLRSCPAGSLGRGVFDFYQSRHFVFPGLPESAPPLLAQHDWVHVIGDYGTTLESEIEVFGLIAWADDDPRGFSLLAMAIGLFQTGLVDSAAGLFESDAGHLSGSGMATRLTDAMRRGAIARPDGTVAKSFLAVDWFDYAELPVEEVRRRFQLPPKSDKAVAAGSVGTWDLAGFSTYQLEHCDLSVLDHYR